MMEDHDQLTKRLFASLPKAWINEATALLCIDLQRLDADPQGPLFQRASLVGAERGLLAYRIQLDEVVERVASLQSVFRQKHLEVIHVRIQSLTANGRERSLLHKSLSIHAAPGSDASEFLPQVAPVGDEIVLNKTSSSPFTSTAIDYVLRNLAITHLVVVGVMTSGCIETTVRDAADRGYLVTLVSDACAARTTEMHEKALKALGALYTQIATTAELIGQLSSSRGPGTLSGS